MKVLKFGGTSMANADSIKRVADIIKAEKDGKIVVVSAPGKREKTDTKVTDLLYDCFNHKIKDGEASQQLLKVQKRFEDIASGLGLAIDMAPFFDKIGKDIDMGAGIDYVASRGEYLSAVILSAYLGYKFIDAADIIKFDLDGVFLPEETNDACAKALEGITAAVVPGFYGKTPAGEIKTFSRGGSDVSGSILARAVKASVYENWTDVDGFMTCDPRIVEKPHLIPLLTYKELRELSYMGANVLHSDSIFPVRKSNIPINIRNTFNPTAKGTMIVPTTKYLTREYSRDDRTITGIAGKKDFVSIFIEKSLMNNELGYARKVLSVLEKHKLSIEHMPSGIDTLSLVVDICGHDKNDLEQAVKAIQDECGADKIEVVENLALIAVVGHGMNRKKGTASKIFSALALADINIRMIDQGSSEINIIIAVENNDYENAIRAIYNTFI